MSKNSVARSNFENDEKKSIILALIVSAVVVLAFVLAFVAIKKNRSGRQNVVPVETETQASNYKYSDSGEVIVTNLEELIDALGNTDIYRILFQTEEEITIIIPEGDYTSKEITIDAPYGEITNYGNFSYISILRISSNTWTEGANGNVIDVQANTSHIVIPNGYEVERISNYATDSILAVECAGTVDEINLNASDSITSIDITGDVYRININATTNLTITGSRQSVSEIEVGYGAGGTMIESAIPVYITSYSSATVAIEPGAEGSTLEVGESTIDITLSNNSADAMTLHSNSGDEEVPAGEEKKIASSSTAGTATTTTTSTPATGTSSTGASVSAGGGTSSSGSSSSGASVSSGGSSSSASAGSGSNSSAGNNTSGNTTGSNNNNSSTNNSNSNSNSTTATSKEVSELKLNIDELKKAINKNNTDISDLKTTNEKLVATNEELQKTNEALQKTNEDLASKLDQLIKTNIYFVNPSSVVMHDDGVTSLTAEAIVAQLGTYVYAKDRNGSWVKGDDGEKLKFPVRWVINETIHTTGVYQYDGIVTVGDTYFANSSVVTATIFVDNTKGVIFNQKNQTMDATTAKQRINTRIYFSEIEGDKNLAYVHIENKDNTDGKKAHDYKIRAVYTNKENGKIVHSSEMSTTFSLPYGESVLYPIEDPELNVKGVTDYEMYIELIIGSPSDVTMEASDKCITVDLDLANMNGAGAKVQVHKAETSYALQSEVLVQVAMIDGDYVYSLYNIMSGQNTAVQDNKFGMPTAATTVAWDSDIFVFPSLIQNHSPTVRCDTVIYVISGGYGGD